jgi:hypothetical protein
MDVMAVSPAEHRKLAALYKQRASVAATAREQDDLLRMAQEHLLLIDPDPLMMPPA